MVFLELEKLDWKPGDKILWFGIGNPCRQDDGLGPRLIGALENRFKKFDFESNYQLNAEDALLISGYDGVVFVDATVEPEAQAPFGIREVQPSNEIAFSTHEMSLGVVVALCAQLYQKTPKTYLLTLPGYSWEIGEELSPGASQNLQQTIDAIADRYSSFI